MGNDTWKWALVLVLSAVFILVAHQAYKSLNNADDQFPPPDDYLKGDSYDLDHGLTPGPVGGTPIDGVPDSGNPPKTGAPIQPDNAVASRPHIDASAWDNLASETR